MATYHISKFGVGINSKDTYVDIHQIVHQASNVYDSAEVAKKSVKSLPTSQVLMGKFNDATNHHDDESSHVDGKLDVSDMDYASLQAYAGTLQAAFLKSKRPPRTFNPDFDIPDDFFSKMFKEGQKLWYQFSSEDKNKFVR